MRREWMLPEDDYGEQMSQAFAQHTAANGSIPADKVSDLAKAINGLLAEAVHEARDLGYEEGQLGEDL